jgi:hypothetical protein
VIYLIFVKAAATGDDYAPAIVRKRCLGRIPVSLAPRGRSARPPSLMELHASRSGARPRR